MLYYICKVEKDNENKNNKISLRNLKKIVDKEKFIWYNISVIDILHI